MKPDALTQFTKLRTELTQERQRLTARIQAIDRAFADHTGAVPVPSGKPAATRKSRSTRRIRNPISLKAGVIKLTREKPLTKQEIFEGLAKLRWKTTSKKPQKLLDVLLYGKNPKFRNKGGKFSLASRSAK